MLLIESIRQIFTSINLLRIVWKISSIINSFKKKHSLENSMDFSIFIRSFYFSSNILLIPVKNVSIYTTHKIVYKFHQY